MEAKSTDKQTFQLIENGQILGELIYENLFFLNAEITINNTDLYHIKHVGIFGNSIIVTKNGIETANIKMDWRGNITFTFQEGQEFILKPTGSILNNKFTFENKNEEELIQLNPKFNWKKFQYNYEITYDERPKDILFVLLGVYASNYFIATMSGATAGLA